MKKAITISNQSFEVLKSTGHVVPRDEANYIITSFIVGKEYAIQHKDTKEVINVRCTQDCPHHLKAIN